MKAAKQNQKFPFHFLSAPPTPPTELNQKGRKIFGFCQRESASAPEAQSERTIQFRATTHAERAKLGVLLEMGSDFFKQTPPKLICFRIDCARAKGAGLGWHFLQEIPRGFEFRQKHSLREAAVRADAVRLAIVGVSAMPLSI